MQKIAIGSRFPLPKLFVQVYDRSQQQFRRGGYGAITKTLLVLKLTILLLTAALLNVHANSKAQTVTLSGKDLTLQQVFAAIEKQTDYVAFYNVGVLANTKPVTLTVYSMPLKELLNTVFRDQPLDYSIEGKTIILSPKKITRPLIDFSEMLHTGEPTLYITGTLRTAEGELLGGASVRVKQKSNGTISDNKGYFQLKTDEADPVLVISMIGYESMEVIIKKTGSGYTVTKYSGGMGTADVNGGNITFMIVMKKAVSLLDEAQVIAYGKTTRRLSTGSIGTIKGEDIAKQPVMGVLEAIKGRVPGIVVTPYSGNPAAPVRVIIRGRNNINENALTDPLYVIDGIPRNNLNVDMITKNSPVSPGAVQAGFSLTGGENPLIGINPDDVESISILKDADATAIYGSRGANGVILITTKKGKAGPTEFSMGIRNGITTLQRFPKMLNTAEYLAIRREAFRTDGIEPTESNAPDLLVWDANKYTDWQRELAGTGSTTAVNASVGGGTNLSNYRLSAGFYTTKTPMNNGGKNERISISGDFQNASKNQKFKFSISNTLAFLEMVTFSISTINALSPNAPDIYNQKGELNFEPYRVLDGIDRFPFGSLKRPNTSNTIMLESKASVSYELMKGLNMSANGGYEFTLNENNYLIPLASQDPVAGGISSAIYGKSNTRNKFVETKIDYSTFIGKGSLSVQLAVNMQHMTNMGEMITAAMFPNDDMMKSHNNAGFVSTSERNQQYKNVSALGGIHYEWDNKYVINLTGRRDGSSKFGPGKQFGNFGSIGLSWSASDEKWLRKLLPSWFNTLKFRTSYGETGSDAIGNYEYLSRWSRSVSANTPPPLLTYNGINAFHVINPLNQQFQWASSKSQDIGMIIQLLRSKLYMEFTYFRNRTSNQLTTAPLPMITGFASALTNWPANVQNSGLELEINASILQTKDWFLSLGFNITRQRNKLLDFPNLENSPYAGQLMPGRSISGRYLLKYTGINPVTGDYSFEDYNKDGMITRGSGNMPTNSLDDRYIFIDLNEKYSGGCMFSLKYKFIQLGTSFSFINRYRPDPYLGSTIGMMDNIALPDDIKNNHWTQPGDQAKYPRYTTIGLLGPITQSDANYVNGSYLRMENLSISCQLPQKWVSRVKLKGASISLSTNNLFTISPYKGLEPDLLYGIAPIPIPRIIATQLSLSF